VSRSYHTTRRHLKELEHSEYSDKQKKANAIDEVKKELAIKRLVKEQVKAERQSGEQYPPPTSIDSIPIRIVDSSPYIHYPAGPDDLRELMRRLPASLSNGLAGIELCLGKEFQEEDNEENPDDDAKSDPYAGRLGYERLPGIYTGLCLGHYIPDSSIIRLFAYIYSPHLPHRRILEFYMRLKILMTFVHELGHHFDHTSRIARGRWRNDSTEKVEIYAETIEYEWLQEYLIPFLEQRYSDERAKFQSWMIEHIGIEIPLRLLIGDTRSTIKGGGIRETVLFSTGLAFHDFIKAVIEGSNMMAARLEFADDLHMAGEYELALAIIQTVFAKEPNNLTAIILEGEIFVHQERFDAAKNQAEAALRLEPENVEALEVLADAYEGLRQWDSVETLTNQLMQYYKKRKGKGWYYLALMQRVRARIGQNNYVGARTDLDEIAKGEERPKNRRLGLLRRQAEYVVVKLNEHLQQDMNESQHKLAEQLRDELNMAVEQAGQKLHISWPIN
jgi:tetratricopeptide (TPR) repeat protein